MTGVQTCALPIYIQRRYHWLQERVEDGDFDLMKIHPNDNGSDMLTKTLPKEKLVSCRLRACLVDLPIQE